MSYSQSMAGLLIEKANLILTAFNKDIIQLKYRAYILNLEGYN